MYTVLIAEDELFVRLGIKNSIPWERYDMRVVGAVENGRLAWELLQQHKPDILITDIRMPEMDGSQLIQKIQDAAMTPYIIVITCLEDFKLVKDLLSMGIRDYILKATMTEEEIANCLRKALRCLQTSPAHPEPAPEAPPDPGQACGRALRDFFGDRLPETECASLLEANGVSFAEKQIVFALCRMDYLLDSAEAFDAEAHKSVYQNLADLLLYKTYTQRRQQAFFLGNRCFLILLTFPPEYPRDGVQTEAEETLGLMHRDIQDYLHLRFSLQVHITDGGLSGLKACCREARETYRVQYVRGAGSEGYEWRDDLGARAEEECGRLEEYAQWLGECRGRAAMEQYNGRVRELRSRLLHSPEEMMSALLGIVHLIRALFQSEAELNGHLELESRKCEKIILKYPYLPDGIAAISVFLQICRQDFRQNKLCRRREIQAAVRLIHEELQDPGLSLSQVARQVNLSENYLSTLFHQGMEQSFVKYLANARIERAKELLGNEELRILDVAMQTGFSGEAYFSRVFKKLTGVAPSEWRAL